MAERIFIGWFLVSLLVTTTSAHYNLIWPKPYNVIHCDKPKCKTPCPPIWRSGQAKAQNSPATTNAIWRRGQYISVQWHANNHHGGYIRRSLVPVKQMFNDRWHQITAFQWGCFAQGRFKCRYKLGPKSDRLRFLRACGTDDKGSAFSSIMRVPEVFPDGDYVFSQVWYGGVNVLKSGKKIMFPDFKTCAFVRIQGGRRLKATYRPQFNAGYPIYPDMPRGICRSFGSYVGECGGLSCRENRVRWDVPAEFRNGKYPPSVQLKYLKRYSRRK